jgi:hypothetical protein
VTIDYDALERSFQPQPRPAQAAHHVAPQRSQGIPGVVLFIGGILVACVVFWLLSGGSIPTPGPRPTPTPDIDVAGLHVMTITPDSRSGLTKGQNEFLDSAKIADFVETKGGKFRRYPESQDISNEQQVWRDIRKELTPDQPIGVLQNSRLKTLRVPDGIDAGIQVLEREIK